MSQSIYEKLSEERKSLQSEGLIPEWYSTGSWQFFKEKYMYEASSVKEQFDRIARTAARHLEKIGLSEIAYQKFFNMMWRGWLSPSTPVLANMGTTRGLPVSCSGSVIPDSVEGFYSDRKEAAILTKHGFGTSGFLGNIRPRGSPISVGGKASGVLPVVKGHIQTMRDVCQGTARRGSWAGYLPIDHADFDELADFVLAEPDDANVGWVIYDQFNQRLSQGDPEAVRRIQKTLKLKMTMGKGYYSFIDKINRKRPQMYVDHGLYVQASNLCDEITLFADEEHTFTCVLSSLNAARWHEWKDTDTAYWATVFLDCVAEEFIQKARLIPGLEKAVRFTEKGRALGLGLCGLHTLFQQDRIPFEDLSAMFLSSQISKHIHDESLKASRWMADVLGEPYWCKGYGVRNTHRIAIAPTKSTADLMGGVSEGISPDPAMTYLKTTAAGEIDRTNSVLIELMKERGTYTKRYIREISDAQGSVQHVNWLTADEKRVFKTAFEINQEVVLRMASSRARYIDQWQSLNLFFSAEEDPAWIAHCHKIAFEDENILGLYYITTQAGVTGSKECEACQG